MPMLMEMDKVDAALDKAVESGDPQLGRYIGLFGCVFCCASCAHTHTTEVVSLSNIYSCIYFISELHGQTNVFYMYNHLPYSLFDKICSLMLHLRVFNLSA